MSEMVTKGAILNKRVDMDDFREMPSISNISQKANLNYTENYYTMLDAYAPAVPFVHFSIGSVVTDTIPPKYVKSLSVNRTKDSIGTFVLNIIVPIKTFERGSEESIVWLASLFGQVDSIASDTITINGVTKTTKEGEKYIPCEFSYGWRGKGIWDATYSKAFIYGFSLNYSTGKDGIYSYTIKGYIADLDEKANSTNKCIPRAEIFQRVSSPLSSTSNRLVSSEDYNRYITAQDWSEADRQFKAKYEKEGTDVVDFTKVPAGYRISDLVEVLALYIFGDQYDVQVDHTDKIYSEETQVATVIGATYSSELTNPKSCSLMSWLLSMIRVCHDVSGYDVRLSNGVLLTYDELTSYKDAAENYKKTIGSMDRREKAGVGATKVGQKTLGTELYFKVSDMVRDGFTYQLGDEFVKAVETAVAAKPCQYDISYVDKPSNDGKGLIKIGANASNDSNNFYYEIGNNVRDGRVLSFSIDDDLTYLVATTKSLYDENKNAYAIDPITGDYIKTAFSTADSDTDGLSAENYADKLIGALVDKIDDNHIGVTMKVVSDLYSRALQITDTVTVRLTVNNGDSIFTGRYVVVGIKDDIGEDATFETELSLKILESSRQETLRQIILSKLASPQ